MRHVLHDAGADGSPPPFPFVRRETEGRSARGGDPASGTITRILGAPDLSSPLGRVPNLSTSTREPSCSASRGMAACQPLGEELEGGGIQSRSNSYADSALGDQPDHELGGADHELCLSAGVGRRHCLIVDLEVGELP